MSDDENDVETSLRVGAVVVLHLGSASGPPGPRYRTYVRGWHKFSHIIIDRPKIRNRYIDLQEGQVCTVRYVASGNACSFDSLILTWDDRTLDSHCNIAWPDHVHIVPFRRYYRIKVNLPCQFRIEDEVFDGEIRDLSMGGCGIQTKNAPAEDTAISLAFALPDGLSLENVQAVVRDVRPIGSDMFLGCEFTDRQEDVQNDIAFSVSVAFEKERGAAKKPSGAHVLIIDESEAAVSLRREFERHNLDVVVASGTIDGLQRLRTTTPAALLVSQEQRDLTGMDIVRLVKLTRGFELLPVFLYGGNGEPIAEKALQTGVREYYGDPIDAAKIAEDVVKCVNALTTHA